MEKNPNASVYDVLTEIKKYFVKNHESFMITQTENRLVIENHLANYKKTRNYQNCVQYARKPATMQDGALQGMPCRADQQLLKVWIAGWSL